FPPASAAALGADLARRWGVPLVLDFRDLWFGPGGYMPRSNLHRWLHVRMERRIAGAAAALVAVSDAMADFLSERYRIARERVMTIPNGFDASHAPSTIHNTSVANAQSPAKMAHETVSTARSAMSGAKRSAPAVYHLPPAAFTLSHVG